MASLINDLSKEWVSKEEELLKIIEEQKEEIELLKKSLNTKNN